jgi:V/A-type H+-transporting ATPase subunit I
MARVSAVVLDRDERTVLNHLGRIGAVHLSRTAAGPDTAPLNAPDHGFVLTRIGELLDRVEALCTLFGIEALPAPAGEPAALSPAAAEKEIGEIEGKADALAERRGKLEERWNQVNTVLEQVAGYAGLAVPFDQIGKSAFLHFAIGQMPAESLVALEKDIGDDVVLLRTPAGKDAVRLVAVTSRKGRFALDTALKRCHFQPEDAPEGLSAGDVSEETLNEKRRLAGDLKDNHEAFARLAAESAPALSLVRRGLGVERQILQAEEKCPRTGATLLINGWAPADRVSDLQRVLHEATNGRCYLETSSVDDLPDEEVPVLLRHPRVLKPFAALVGGYGLPRYNELEPTLFVALTYMLMFGMMFGDVGHGAVLAVAGLAAFFASRDDKVRNVGVLLVCVGFSSAVFGVVYGSYFGIRSLHHYALWRDPLKQGEVGGLLVMAVTIGVLVISAGLVLNIVNHFRRGDFVAGLLDKFGAAGAVLYWGGLALLLKYAAFQERGLLGLMVTLVILLPLAAVALKEPIVYVLRRRAGKPTHNDSFLEALISSVIEAFEAAMSYMANTISFVRLAAYAMSHAALLMATFVLADEVAKAPAGGVLRIVVIVVGNAAAIALEGIICGVQALRLEYYEFFSKFFSGTGEAYKPFRFSTEEPQG